MRPCPHYRTDTPRTTHSCPRGSMMDPETAERRGPYDALHEASLTGADAWQSNLLGRVSCELFDETSTQVVDEGTKTSATMCATYAEGLLVPVVLLQDRLHSCTVRSTHVRDRWAECTRGIQQQPSAVY